MGRVRIVQVQCASANLTDCMQRLALIFLIVAVGVVGLAETPVELGAGCVSSVGDIVDYREVKREHVINPVELVSCFYFMGVGFLLLGSLRALPFCDVGRFNLMSFMLGCFLLLSPLSPLVFF